MHSPISFSFFFFNDTATTEIYTLSLHDALPICPSGTMFASPVAVMMQYSPAQLPGGMAESTLRLFTLIDRKSTRLNSSHVRISYAVFCLEKKKHKEPQRLALEQHELWMLRQVVA